MDLQGWPLQRLLLLLVGASVLDAYSGTTEIPHSTNYSLKEGINVTALEMEEESYKHMMQNPKAFSALKEAAYRFLAEGCWSIFVQQMTNVSTGLLCEWSIVSRPYSNLTFCLENMAEKLEYGYPNALSENYIIFSHRLYFLNCTLVRPLLLDPPENILMMLILTPICLIPLLVTLVVWRSKDGEMQV